jgi:hypothetical protein
MIKRLMPVIVSVVVLVLVYSGWYLGYGPCGILSTRAAVEKMGDVISRWDDAEKVASQTPRMALAVQIQALQEIKRDTEDLTVPECMSDTKEHLIKAQEAAITGYVNFLGNADDGIVNANFGEAANYFGQVTDGLVAVKSCAPFCK